MKRFEASQSALPVYFYCARSAAEPERSKPDTVLASILRQLSCVKPDAPLLSPVIEKYKRQGEGFNSNGLDLDDSRDLIVRLAEEYSMTIIVVDALDECDPQMRQSLLDAFEHVLRESVGLVKIFVSSRDDQDIVYSLRDYPNLDISSDRNRADIKAYVKTETQKLVKTGQLLRNSRAKEEMTALIIDQVSSGAGGMFRWASLQLDVLRVLKRDEDVRAQLRRLPPKLEQLYLEVYNNLIAAQGEVGRSIIDNALKWLLCGQGVMRASTFLMAVAANLKTSDGDISVDSLLELCNNFVVYDEGLDVFRFAHLSVGEYLEKRPEFAEVWCDRLAAECCLLQILASSNCPNAEHFMSSTHLLRLRGSPTGTASSPCTRFLEYANQFCMEYCKSIPKSNRSHDTDFGRMFQFFLSDKLGPDSPLNAWVQWYCSREFSETDSVRASPELQQSLTNCSDSLSRSFYVATYFGFSEIVTSYLKDRGLGNKDRDEGLLLAAIAAQHDVFDVLREDRENSAMTEEVLFHAVRASDKGRLASLLERVPDTMITQPIFVAIVESQDDEVVNFLLDRYPGLTITEKMLDVAVESASLDAFRLLVARAAKPVITDHMLRIPMSWRLATTKPVSAYLEKIVILLDKAGESGLTPRLMASAVWSSDESVIETILKRGSAGNITEEMMVNAAQIGSERFCLMLQYGGKVTDTVLDIAASRSDARTWQVLLEQGYESSVTVERLKLAALNQRHDDTVSILLDHVDDTTLANELTGLIHEVVRLGHRNNSMRQLLERAKDVTISQDMLLAAILNPYFDRLGIVKMLLERSSEVKITEDMLLVAAEDRWDGIELIQIFLEREGEAEITKYVLMAAACNHRQGFQIMQLLLEQCGAAALTGDVLICAARKCRLELVLEILERSEARVITGCLLEAAAANVSCGGKLVKLMLARAEPTDFPEDLFIEAVGNAKNGIEIILVIEETFGRISMTESLLAKCVPRATKDTIELLLSRTDPTQITNEILISAMSNHGYQSNDVQRVVAEQSLHIPVTAEVLGLAAEYGERNVFGFLWNRYRSSSVPEDLINAAARNNLYPYDTHNTFEFLLQEADCVEIGEETMIAIVCNWVHGCHFFNLLLQQGLQADITEGVPKTLLMDGGIKAKCRLPAKLQLSNRMKVTEDLFRLAACRWNGDLLLKLSEFCELKSTPEEWLDIAQLYKVIHRYETRILKTLLGRGVDPNVAGPNGLTPLAAATQCNNEVAVQMLLSAGALPDGNPMSKRSPLFKAAQGGRYDIVRMLVNAGASINFRDKNGMTPSRIALLNGKIRVFKYLEQCRKEQEGGQETPKST